MPGSDPSPNADNFRPGSDPNSTADSYIPGSDPNSTADSYIPGSDPSPNADNFRPGSDPTGYRYQATAAPHTAVVFPPGADSAVSILANELSSDRRRRLSLVLDRHLPTELRAQLTVSGFDAAAAGGRSSEHGRFSAILLDAPCSSERHVLADNSALAQWTPARVKFLAQRQWSLLSSAFLLLAPGGCILYSTCALSPAENDGVVARLLKKQKDRVELLVPEPVAVPGLPPGLSKQAESTEFGRMYMPDSCSGAGPIYTALLRKLS
ncbi:MAG: 16S rRNA methyltransferase [Spirochaetes bacterium]|nr:16S rRNA methyltransferase [Spirochaetota bacterium]